jgi:hypothetical protein
MKFRRKFDDEEMETQIDAERKAVNERRKLKNAGRSGNGCGDSRKNQKISRRNFEVH